MKKITGSLILVALLISQATKPYLFWTREKRVLTTRRPTEYQVRVQDGNSLVLLTKRNQRINQYQRRVVLQDTTTLMESNIIKLEAAIEPSHSRERTELGRLLSRLSGTLLFGEK